MRPLFCRRSTLLLLRPVVLGSLSARQDAGSKGPGNRTSSREGGRDDHAKPRSQRTKETAVCHVLIGDGEHRNTVDSRYKEPFPTTLLQPIQTHSRPFQPTFARNTRFGWNRLKSAAVRCTG